MRKLTNEQITEIANKVTEMLEVTLEIASKELALLEGNQEDVKALDSLLRHRGITSCIADPRQIN